MIDFLNRATGSVLILIMSSVFLMALITAIAKMYAGTE